MGQALTSSSPALSLLFSNTFLGAHNDFPYYCTRRWRTCPAEAQEDFYHIIFLLQCTKEFSLADMITVQHTSLHFTGNVNRAMYMEQRYNYLEKFLCFPFFQSSLCGKRNLILHNPSTGRIKQERLYPVLCVTLKILYRLKEN